MLTAKEQRNCFSRRLALLLALLFPLLVNTADADADWIQFTWENDLFAGEDDGYTNGLAFAWGHEALQRSGGAELPRWLGALVSASHLGGYQDRELAVSYALAHAMYTPQDIERADLIPDDRPYAGLLLWNASIYAYDAQRADGLSLTLGMVGPAAGARRGQRLIHRATGGDEPQGWSNQLHNEPVFAVDVNRLWRLGTWQSGGLEFDVIGGGNAGVGNLRSSLDAGVGFRLGSQLVSSWSTISMIPARTVNTFARASRPAWQLYFTLAGRYVFNDITIDGNTFRDSHSVPLERGQAFLSSGFAFNRSSWGLSLSYQLGTDQYKGQQAVNRFGSLSLAYFF